MLLFRVLVAAAATLSACSPSASSSAATWPSKIAFGETTYDFGHVDQGAKVIHAFAFRNTGGLDLTIDNVRTSCDCIAAVAPARVIAAGRDGTIEAAFDTARDVGRKMRTITVYSNDPAQPVTTLTLQGSIEADVAVDPPRLYVGHLARGQTAPTEVRVAIGERAVVSIGNVDATGKVVEVTLRDPTPGTSSRRLSVSVKEDAPLGRFEASASIHTSSRLHPALSIPITGVVDGDIVVSPRELSFGAIMPGRQAVLSLGLRSQGRTPVHVTAAELAPAIGDAQVVTVHDGRDYRLTVAVKDPLPTGRLQGTLRIHTDHPEQPLISVPFSGRVVEKK